MIVIRCSIVAMIIFIPLTSIQHFIEPLSDCLLADICNHTWIPECGEDENTKHLRLFIDECDLFEYNCDNDLRYRIVNYSDCFGPVTCPTLGRLFTKIQGYAIYHADRRMMRYYPSATTPARTIRTTLRPTVKRKPGKRRYTPEKTRKIKRRTTECAPCMRSRTEQPYVMTIRKPNKKITPKRLPPNRPTTQRLTTRIITSLTTQILRTATVGTVVLNKVTVWKNGKIMVKIIKGYQKPKLTTDDSDFLE